MVLIYTKRLLGKAWVRMGWVRLGWAGMVYNGMVCQRHCEARSITILITKLPEVINFACITQITQTV